MLLGIKVLNLDKMCKMQCRKGPKSTLVSSLLLYLRHSLSGWFQKILFQKILSNMAVKNLYLETCGGLLRSNNSNSLFFWKSFKPTVSSSVYHSTLYICPCCLLYYDFEMLRNFYRNISPDIHNRKNSRSLNLNLRLALY